MSEQEGPVDLQETLSLAIAEALNKAATPVTWVKYCYCSSPLCADPICRDIGRKVIAHAEVKAVIDGWGPDSTAADVLRELEFELEILHK